MCNTHTKQFKNTDIKIDYKKIINIYENKQLIQQKCYSKQLNFAKIDEEIVTNFISTTQKI